MENAATTTALVSRLLATDDKFRTLVSATVVGAANRDKKACDEARMRLALYLAMEAKDGNFWDALYYSLRGEMSDEQRNATMMQALTDWLPIASAISKALAYQVLV
jgi:hypothetical protein